TMPLDVVSSSSIARTIRRSPRGFSFMSKKPPSRESDRRLARPSPGRVHPSGTLGGRVPTTAPIYRRSGDYSPWLAVCNEVCQAPRRSVLGAAVALHGLGHVRRVLEDLREAHNRHGVVQGHGAAIDLFEEVDQLLVAAELGV